MRFPLRLRRSCDAGASHASPGLDVDQRRARRTGGRCPLPADSARMAKVPIPYFTDVLCVWAFIAQLRVDEAKARFDGDVAFEHRFCSVFGDTAGKIATQWGAKGGYAGFNAHLTHAAAAFPEVRLNPDIWLTVRPASSTGPHLFLKAAQLAEQAGRLGPGVAEQAIWAMRGAFFHR